MNVNRGLIDTDSLRMLTSYQLSYTCQIIPVAYYSNLSHHSVSKTLALHLCCLCKLSVAASQIQHVYHVAVSRTVFNAWHGVTQTARKTREYFEVRLVLNIEYYYISINQ